LQEGHSDSDESYYSGLEDEDPTTEEDDGDDDDDDVNSYDYDIDKPSGRDENAAMNEDDEFGNETSSQSENDNDDRSEEDFPIHSSFPDDMTNKQHIEEEDRKRKKTTKDQNNELSGLDENKIGFTFDDADTSDEEEIRNTVGNIPMEWYRDYSHIGYDVRGVKIAKPAQGDELEKFLSAEDDPDFWRTIRDHTNQENVKLSDEDLEIINKIQASHFPDSGFDPYEPYVDWFTGEKMLHPIKDNPDSKQSFMPSKWEHKRVMKLVHAIKNGWIKPKTVKDEKSKFYLMWRNEDLPKKDHPMHWPAPKMKLPGHEESYNPPPEYLLNEDEIKQWEDKDPEDRSRNFIPKKYDCLRKVPAYSNYIQERFERCLDLYLCPRQRRIRLKVDPDDLIPKLPKPRDLQPFPTSENLIYCGHEAPVTCISVDPSGQWLVSGSEDKSIRFWEIATCRCMKVIRFDEEVRFVEWGQNSNLCILAVAVGKCLYIVNPNLGDKLVSSNTDNILGSSETISAGTDKVTWEEPSIKERSQGIRLCIRHQKLIKQGSWHHKCDYISLVLDDTGSQSIVIHLLTKRSSQMPFKKPGGLVQCVQFHPRKPFLFVATQTSIRVYHLQKQELIKKLTSGVKWISSMDIHPQGDNVIIGSYDKRLCWFDNDLSTKPYKTLRHHKKAIRQVKFHPNYPLFASASDDGTVIICHGKVFSDLMQNPLIVPVKIIRCHKPIGDFGVTDCAFHPSQPWIFTAGADNTVKLCT